MLWCLPTSYAVVRPAADRCSVPRAFILAFLNKETCGAQTSIKVDLFGKVTHSGEFREADAFQVLDVVSFLQAKCNSCEPHSHLRDRTIIISTFDIRVWCEITHIFESGNITKSHLLLLRCHDHLTCHHLPTHILHWVITWQFIICIVHLERVALKVSTSAACIRQTYSYVVHKCVTQPNGLPGDKLCFSKWIEGKARWKGVMLVPAAQQPLFDSLIASASTLPSPGHFDRALHTTSQWSPSALQPLVPELQRHAACCFPVCCSVTKKSGNRYTTEKQLEDTACSEGA